MAYKNSIANILNSPEFDYQKLEPKLPENGSHVQVTSNWYGKLTVTINEEVIEESLMSKLYLAMSNREKTERLDFELKQKLQGKLEPLSEALDEHFQSWSTLKKIVAFFSGIFRKRLTAHHIYPYQEVLLLYDSFTDFNEAKIKDFMKGFESPLPISPTKFRAYKRGVLRILYEGIKATLCHRKSLAICYSDMGSGGVVEGIFNLAILNLIWGRNNCAWVFSGRSLDRGNLEFKEYYPNFCNAIQNYRWLGHFLGETVTQIDTQTFKEVPAKEELA